MEEYIKNLTKLISSISSLGYRIELDSKEGLVVDINLSNILRARCSSKSIQYYVHTENSCQIYKLPELLEIVEFDTKLRVLRKFIRGVN